MIIYFSLENRIKYLIEYVSFKNIICLKTLSRTVFRSLLDYGLLIWSKKTFHLKLVVMKGSTYIFKKTLDFMLLRHPCLVS